MNGLCKIPLIFLIFWHFTFLPTLLFGETPGDSRSNPNAEATVWIESVDFKGLDRTDATWIHNYLDLQLPRAMTRSDTINISRKLMTTGVFSDVKVALRPVDPTKVRLSSVGKQHPEAVILELLVVEKWTTIPVVRGVYGGGTPLRVVGLYDTHVAGKLFTLGGEFRKYGDAPPGFVLFFRDPRAQKGNEYYGAEVWNDRRIRDVYNEKKQITGTQLTHAHKFKARFLAQPFRDSQWISEDSSLDKKVANLKTGIELETIKQFPGRYTESPEYSDQPEASLRRSPNPENESIYIKIQPSFVYDSIESSLLELDGFRFKLQLGPTLFKNQFGSSQEFDAFYYDQWPFDLNMGLHFYFWNSSTTTDATQFYLGGFDSVRGFPDGLRSGSTALYSNFELRRILHKSKYLWIQGITFLDGGTAGQTWEQASRVHPLASTGLGFRFAIPQVYRLVFRLDYAWSLVDSSKGITAGMNQFFDPFNPL